MNIQKFDLTLNIISIESVYNSLKIIFKYDHIHITGGPVDQLFNKIYRTAGKVC